MDRIKKYQRIILLIVIITAAIFILPVTSKLTVEEILTYTPKRPVQAAAVLLSLYCTKALVCVIPLTALYISAGIMFHPFWAIAVTYIGLTCEITLGYWIGRYLGSGLIIELTAKNEKAAKAIQYLDRHSAVVVFAAALLPGPLPFDVTSWLFGAAKMDFMHYLTFSLLGASAYTLPWVLAGNNITDPISKEFLLPFLICAVAAAAVLLLLRRLEKKRSNQE